MRPSPTFAALLALLSAACGCGLQSEPDSPYYGTSAVTAPLLVRRQAAGGVYVSVALEDADGNPVGCAGVPSLLVHVDGIAAVGDVQLGCDGGSLQELVLPLAEGTYGLVLAAAPPGGAEFDWAASIQVVAPSDSAPDVLSAVLREQAVIGVPAPACVPGTDPACSGVTCDPSTDPACVYVSCDPSSDPTCQPSYCDPTTDPSCTEVTCDPVTDPSCSLSACDPTVDPTCATPICDPSDPSCSGGGTPSCDPTTDPSCTGFLQARTYGPPIFKKMTKANAPRARASEPNQSMPLEGGP